MSLSWWEASDHEMAEMAVTTIPVTKTKKIEIIYMQRSLYVQDISMHQAPRSYLRWAQPLQSIASPMLAVFDRAPLVSGW